MQTLLILEERNILTYVYFMANTIFDNWQEQLQNPIVSDIASARSAGNVFNHKGEII